MREAMRLVLEGEGFDISEASDGRAALAMVRSERPDLVFLDLNMPGSNGTDVLTQIKADPSTAAVHVIIVTASEPYASALHTESNPRRSASRTSGMKSVGCAAQYPRL